MHVVDGLVLPQRLVLTAVHQEELQLLPGRDFGRAQEARHRKGPTGIGPGGARRIVLAAEPAAQEAGHEAVARPQHIIDLDGEARADQPLVEGIRNGVRVNHAAHRPALQHDDGLRQLADDAQRFQRVFGARRDVHFLFRTDDQVAVGQDRLHVLGHLVRLDVAFLAGTKPRKAPQVRPVVDVEDHA